MGCTLGRAGRPVVYRFRDDFERADGELGNGWSVGGLSGGGTYDSTRNPVISSGRMALTVGAGAAYAWRRIPNLREVRVGVRFSAGSTNAGAVGVIVSPTLAESSTDPIVMAANSMHIAVGPAGRQIDYYTNAVLTSGDTDLYSTSVDTDYEFRIVWDEAAGTVTIYDIDGGSEVVTDGGRWGDTILIENFRPSATVATDKPPLINYVSVVGADTMELPSPNTIKRDGDTLNLGGEFAVGAYDGRVLAAQLTGYGPHNTDEPVVSFTYDTSAGDVDIEGDLDGFYYAVSVDVDYVKLAAGLFSWSAELVALPGRQAPVIEEIRNGADRDNAHSVTGGVPVTFLPGSAKVPTWDDDPDDSGFVPTADGSVRGWAGGNYDNSVTSMVDPYSVYEGAAQVEVSYDGVRWFPVIGRQANNVPGFVRLSNGRVRVTCSLSGGATLLSSEVWDATGETWERTDFNVTDAGSPTTVATYTHPFVKGPSGIALGPDGNLWVCGIKNDRIWRVTPAGHLSTFTSAGIGDPANICAGPDGAMWFTCFGNNRIGRITTAGVITTYSNANISDPIGICSDGTDLWFTSSGNDKIGKLTTAGAFTFFTDASLDNPTGICVGAAGNLWIASTGADQIVKMTPAGVFTAFSTGVGNAPNYICLGPAGLLWYTRTADDAICKITTTGTATTYTAGVPNAPAYICSDGTDLWFTYQDGIGKITTAGTVTLKTNPNIDNPQGICLGPGSNLWFTSYDNNRVGVLNPGSGVVGAVEFGGTLTILHNRAESCAIRLGAADGPELLDLTLRRGMNFIEGRLQSTAASTYGLFRTASETGAAISTYGIKANADNTYDNRYTILSPDAVTQDVTGVSGLSLTGSATSFRFAFSPENADTLDGAATMVEAYFAAVSHRQQVAAR